MKKKLFLSLLCVSTYFVGCTTDEAKNITNKNVDQYSEEIIELRKFLSESLPIDIEKIKYDKTLSNFIIDGDVIMPLEQARGNYSTSNLRNTNKTTQRFSGYIMKSEIASSIQIYISSEVTSEWRIAVNKAINIWNNTNSGINITTATNSESSNVKIIMGHIDSNAAIANAYYPYGGQPGTRIMINTNFYNKLNDDKRINVIIHELGHIFGLAHTDDSSRSLIPCTPASEMTSIMFSIVSDSTTFTTYDSIAISTLYPVIVGTKKLYRFKKGQYYFYTADPCEITNSQNGYVFDGDLGYLYSIQVYGTVPLYRSISGNVQTLSKSKNLPNDIILGYLYTDKQPQTIALYKIIVPNQGLYTTENIGSGPSKITQGYVIHKFLNNDKNDIIIDNNPGIFDGGVIRL